MEIDEKYMARCLQLARCGAGSAAPNPMVGAVIVRDGVIIGEGFHRRCGEAHAEVNAIAAVKDESLLRDSTLYVSLEPCSHYGKTPPCAELIIKKHIPRVVVACKDPFSSVSGKGIKMLRDAGIEVVTGVMEKEAMFLNRFFMTAQILHRPYIILKWAQSIDGFIDRTRKDASEKPAHLSNAATHRMVHKLRSEVQAIMVGSNTAILDNPSLTVRHWVGQSPLRVILDRRLRVPHNYNLFDEKQPTLVYASEKAILERNVSNTKNIEYSVADDSLHFLRKVMTNLYERNIQSVLVEGGSRLHASFLEEGLWDELIIETAPIQLKNGVRAADIGKYSNVHLIKIQSFDNCNKSSVVAFYTNSNV